jgi:hypothetical protein
MRGVPSPKFSWKVHEILARSISQWLLDLVLVELDGGRGGGEQLSRDWGWRR